MKKQLIIMRGLPGSGKSYLAKKLAENGIIFSTDDFFVKDGVYNFDKEKIGEAHGWNQNRAKSAMDKGEPLIVIDNTNVLAWESKEYVIHGIKLGYEILIKIPETPWAFNFDELLERNQHSLPEDVLKRMVESFDKTITVKDIIDSQKSVF